MSEQPSTWRRVARTFAWGTLILSFPVWGAALLAPFLSLSLEQRGLFAAACIAAGEVMFWGAGLYLGADVIARFRPRRGRKDDRCADVDAGGFAREQERGQNVEVRGSSREQD